MCPCCGEGQAARALVLWLEILRRAWGGPVAVNSGWRCRVHNAEVGGSKSSRHMIGCAADIRAADARSDLQRQKFVTLAMRLFQLPGWEFRPYPSFIHVAAPREEASRSWGGGAMSLQHH